MPHTWALVDSSFPTFGDDEKSGRKIEKLVDYMKILVEALRYQLENLDTGNWNPAALENFQVDTTKDVGEQLAEVVLNMGNLAGEMVRLSNDMNALLGLSARVEAMGGVVKVDDDGNATLGADGKELHLAGKVYINGKLME